jgi:superfamily II DNA or RNA helicase
VDEGLYESLLTERLNQALAARPDLCADIAAVDDAEQPLTLARHLAPLIERALRTAKTADERAELTRAILAVLPEPEPDEAPHQRDGRIARLDAVSAANRLTALPPRPVTPLADAALMTNGRGEPTLAAELRAELASADRVDLLCAFVKWQGLRLLEGPLMQLRERGVSLRVITTTYLGATDARALDALVDDFGAQVRVNYETDRTRLHAKAWLLRRNTGFHTAYVGSSNLSHAALVDGLEWNVRLSAEATPHLLKKFRDTFDSYWVAREFATYRPADDGERLREALAVASGRRQVGATTITLSGLEVQPKPFQAEMVEELDAERSLHDRHRNLIVAATGTGKTVVAALDYRRLVREVHGRDLTLLFVAHRKEILTQARRMYQEVLTEATFGELLVGGDQPSRWRNVFASIQSLSAERLSKLTPNHFDVVVIDEFHHAEAASYRRLLAHVQPIELLGLTATPERGDGVDVREFFDGRVASELRLWEALEQNLLCPFHYFGVYDGTDLGELAWKRGGYDMAALENVYTGNDARTAIVLKEVRDKVDDVGAVRALGFCVSVEHARYMAERFVTAGISARAVWADTPTAERSAALHDLRNREINVIFTVDLFNEGLDIPEVDTVLFLRPTESATVFLQQLGRGLRLTHGKTVLTALDFVGHQRREFRFDRRFRALTGLGRKDLVRQLEQGFPFLPSGTQIVLDSVAQKVVLDNIKQQVALNKSNLLAEIRAHSGDRLAGYLAEYGRGLGDVLRGDRSWTTLCREAGKLAAGQGPREAQLIKRLPALGHVDDRQRHAAYLRILERGAVAGGVEQRLAEMLFYSLFPDGGGFADAAAGLLALAGEPVLDEMRQVIDIAFDSARSSTSALGELIPDLEQVPLAVHARYSLAEALAGLGVAGRLRPKYVQSGAVWCKEVGADAFFITLKKTETDYSPTTMYRDFALSPELFHWESQSMTSEASKTGQRYIHHRDRGSHVLLFVREAKQYSLGTSPYVFLGPADYVSHEGEKPMAITWRLRRAMPTEVFMASRAAVA